MPTKNQVKNLIISTVILSVILGAVAGGILGAISGAFLFNKFSFLGSYINQDQTDQDKNSQKLILEQELDLQSQTIKVVEEALPSVVSVIATAELRQLPSSSFFNDFFFGWPFDDDQFFGIPNQERNQEPDARERTVASGSGFIVTSDGLVITNRHVVTNTNADYSIVLTSGETFKAKVVDRDTVQDLAVLRITKKQDSDVFPVLKLGESDTVKIGQTVIAIGNTLGEFRNTVTRGIVSGINRTITAGGVGIGSELIEGAIQTDAAISSGNSGGPLLNLAGQVIGINTAVSSQGENIGFALPVDQVRLVLESIKKYGKIVRPFLGVRYIMLNKDVAKKNNMKISNGALIVRGENREDLAVIPGSPADKAGLKENDIILEVDGKKIVQGSSLQGILSLYQPGDTVSLKIYRAGKEMDIKVVLEDRGDF